MAAAPALSPALATITTKSAEAISSTRFLVRPARSLSQPPSEKRSGALPEVLPAKAEAVKHAIELSEGKYCSVSAMLKKTATLKWRYEILAPAPGE